MTQYNDYIQAYNEYKAICNDPPLSPTEFRRLTSRLDKLNSLFDGVRGDSDEFDRLYDKYMPEIVKLERKLCI